VRALSTLRVGGSSRAPYASLNLGSHVGDASIAVAKNRRSLREAAGLPNEPCWLSQVHGTRVVDLDSAVTVDSGVTVGEADAAVTADPGRVCAILTADCLPVLLAAASGGRVAAAHAGWRGLAGGVIEAAVQAMGVAPRDLLAWLGPAIGPRHFEVGPEVREAFLKADPGASMAFTASLSGRSLEARDVPVELTGGGEQGAEGHRAIRGERDAGRGQGAGVDARFMADIYLLARRRLARLGIERIYGGGECTYSSADRYFSYRRDGQTGRQASLIWLERAAAG
jgi:YfiH family protein